MGFDRETQSAKLKSTDSICFQKQELLESLKAEAVTYSCFPAVEHPSETISSSLKSEASSSFSTSAPRNQPSEDCAE